MAQTIKLKRSAQSGASGIPSTSDLALGEVGINTYHGKMYIKKDDGTESIVEVGSTGSFLPLSGGSLTGNLSLGDNVKAQFGAGNDLQIYHDGNHSYIQDAGTGNLYLAGDTNVGITNSAGNEWKVKGTTDGAVELYYNNTQRLATTSTGISATGDIDASGLLKVGVNDSEYANNYIRFKPTGAAYIDHSTVGQDVNFRLSASSSLDTTPLTISTSGIDVTGSVTADSLTVDTSNTGNGINYGFDIRNSASGSGTSYAMPAISWSNGGLRWASVHGERNSAGGYGGLLKFYTMNSSGNATERLKIDNNGDISFYNDSAAQGLFWDSSTSRLGLGVTNPDTALHVETSSDTVVKVEKTGGNYIQLHGTGAGGRIKSDGQINFDVGSNSGALNLASNGNATFSGSVTANAGVVVDNITIDANKIATNQASGHSGDFTIDAAGDIVLDAAGNDIKLKANGTTFGQLTNDSGQLIIYNAGSQMLKGNSGANALFQGNLNIPNGSLMVGATTAPSSYYAFANNLVVTGDSANRAGMTISGTATSMINLSDGTGLVGFIDYNHSNDSMTLGTAASNALVIDSSQNATFSGSVTAPTLQTSSGNIVITGQEIYSNSEYSGNDGAVRINRFGYQGGQTKFRDVNIYDGKGTSILTVDGSTGNTNIPNGSLMVGSTTAPQEKLHVYTTGDSRVEAESTTGFAAFKATNNLGSYGWYVDNSADKFHLYDFTDNANRLTLDGSGKVGIGTSSPSAKVHIDGATSSGLLKLDVNAGVTGNILFRKDDSRSTSLVEWTIQHKNDNQDFIIYGYDGTTFKNLIEYDWSASTTKLGSGNVNIPNGGLMVGATTAPSAKLEVQGGTTYPAMKLSRDGGSAGTQGYTTYGHSAIGYSGGTGADTYIVSEHGFAFGVNAGTNALTITDTGRVGIGTSNPANGAKLHTAGAIISTQATLSSFNFNNAGFDFIESTKVGRFFSTSTDTTGGVMTFTTGQNGSYTERMRIDASGNVGIGNSNPSAFNSLGGKNVVVGSGAETNNLTLFSDDTADGNGYGHVAFADSNVSSSTAQYAGLIQYFHGDNTMRFYTNATERTRIDSSGNLLVGTTSTTVGAGGAGTTGFRVDGSNGIVQAASDGTVAGIFNRTTSDGSIVEFRKNGTATVGSIGTLNSDLTIGSGDRIKI